MLERQGHEEPKGAAEEHGHAEGHQEGADSVKDRANSEFGLVEL